MKRGTALSLHKMKAVLALEFRRVWVLKHQGRCGLLIISQHITVKIPQKRYDTADINFL